MLTITADLLSRLHAHLESGYPNEACGILLGDIAGDVKSVKDLALVTNVWETESEREGQRNRYLIAPEDVAR
ncbi:MAG TPA: Mov34/MPN/PAD-1 family protein, partial [Anaerolineae bacterium]